MFQAQCEYQDLEKPLEAPVCSIVCSSLLWSTLIRSSQSSDFVGTPPHQSRDLQKSCTTEAQISISCENISREIASLHSSGAASPVTCASEAVMKNLNQAWEFSCLLFALQFDMPLSLTVEEPIRPRRGGYCPGTIWGLLAPSSSLTIALLGNDETIDLSKI
jgi:hypothetical protein